MYAAAEGHTDIVRLLLDRGANTELADNVSTGLLRGAHVLTRCVGVRHWASRTGGRR